MSILKTIGLYEFKSVVMLKRLLAELIGTFVLISLALSGVHEVKSTTGYALANGFLLASVIAFTGHISGGHVNPAVTLGMLMCDYIKLLPAVCYIIMQLIGAVLGHLMAKMIAYREPKLKALKMDERSEFSLEVLQTFLLVSVALSVTDPRRNSRGVGSAALAIGLSVAASLCAVSDYRGCMNPAASLAGYMRLRRHKWAAWVGPLVGGLLAGLVYRFVLSFSRPVRIRVAYENK